MSSRLTGSARKYAETIELDQIRRSTDEDKDTREGMTAGVKYLLRSPERAVGVEDATKKRQVQEFFEKRLQRRPGHGQMGQRSSESVLATKAEGLNVELKRMGWLIFEKNSMTMERQERVFGAAEGEYEFAAIRGALMKLFPDTIISQEKQSAPDRKLGHVTDRRPNDRFKSRFRKPRHGRQGVTQPMRLMHRMQNKTGRVVRGRVRLDDSLTLCFDCNRFGQWSGDPICLAKDKHNAQEHITSCTLKETVHVDPESFVTNSISFEQELRGAGACDSCCNRTVAGS